MERIIRNGNLETQYSAEDFINPSSFDSRDAKQKAFVVLNAGYVQGIVFAEYLAYSEQDALDEAADAGKLDGLQCDETELADYQIGTDSEGNPEYEGIINLGNAGEPFASESLDLWVVPASIFAEDTALMSSDRVLAHLEEWRDQAEREYQTIPANADEWSAAYRKVSDLDDALTLFRLTINR